MPTRKRKVQGPKRHGVAVAPAQLAVVRRLQKRLSARAGKRISLSSTIGEAARRALKR